MNRRDPHRPGVIPYALAIAFGSLLSVTFFGALALGECFASDGPDALRACTGAKQIEVATFSASAPMLLLAAPLVGRKWPALGLPLALLAPFIALAVTRIVATLLV